MLKVRERQLKIPRLAMMKKGLENIDTKQDILTSKWTDINIA